MKNKNLLVTIELLDTISKEQWRKAENFFDSRYFFPRTGGKNTNSKLEELFFALQKAIKRAKKGANRNLEEEEIIAIVKEFEQSSPSANLQKTLKEELERFLVVEKIGSDWITYQVLLAEELVNKRLPDLFAPIYEDFVKDLHLKDMLYWRYAHQMEEYRYQANFALSLANKPASASLWPSIEKLEVYHLCYRLRGAILLKNQSKHINHSKEERLWNELIVELIKQGNQFLEEHKSGQYVLVQIYLLTLILLHQSSKEEKEILPKLLDLVAAHHRLLTDAKEKEIIYKTLTNCCNWYTLIPRQLGYHEYLWKLCRIMDDHDLLRQPNREVYPVTYLNAVISSYRFGKPEVAAYFRDKYGRDFDAAPENQIKLQTDLAKYYWSKQADRLEQTRAIIKFRDQRKEEGRIQVVIPSPIIGINWLMIKIKVLYEQWREQKNVLDYSGRNDVDEDLLRLLRNLNNNLNTLHHKKGLISTRPHYVAYSNFVKLMKKMVKLMELKQTQINIPKAKTTELHNIFNSTEFLVDWEWVEEQISFLDIGA